jgi:hypothetical protein
MIIDAFSVTCCCVLQRVHNVLPSHTPLIIMQARLSHYRHYNSRPMIDTDTHPI